MPNSSNAVECAPAAKTGKTIGSGASASDHRSKCSTWPVPAQRQVAENPKSLISYSYRRRR